MNAIPVILLALFAALTLHAAVTMESLLDEMVSHDAVARWPVLVRLDGAFSLG